MSDDPRRAVARIDLEAVEHNCATIKAMLSGGAELCAVVKADGYGHGAVACATAALRGGAGRLAVVSASEAEDLRRSLPDTPILVMGALTEAELRPALETGAELGAWHPAFVAHASQLARELGRPARLHLKHDSGMGRLGERDPGAALELARSIAADPDLELAGVWTHFATADEEDTAYFDRQLAAFTDLADAVRPLAPGCIVHAANSAATYRSEAAHLDMVRCGIAIYGLSPFGADPDECDLVPALSLASTVAAVKRFERGSTAGYGRTWAAPADTWVGVLPVGYGDGARRGLSNNGEVLIGGRRHPIVGTVSMDNLTVDLGARTDVKVGDEAILIGIQGSEQILAEDVARRLGTINYEVTCGISQRVPRDPHGGAS